jgi:hypothetical protein
VSVLPVCLAREKRPKSCVAFLGMSMKAITPRLADRLCSLGYGFLAGMPLGPLTLFVFIDKIVSWSVLT